jgi:hypothetical protein
MNSATRHDIPMAMWEKHYSDRSQRALGKARREGAKNICTVCGKALVNPVWAVIGGGDTFVHPSIAPTLNETNNPGWMGLWAFGPECAQFVPKAFRITGVS